MKISELLQSGSIDRAMQIPVAISGENVKLTLGQLIDALATAIVPFSHINTKTYTYAQSGIGKPTLRLPIVWMMNGFYALQETTTSVSGILRRQAVIYRQFDGSERFYGDNNQVRTDCLFISNDGRLYRYNGTDLISAGISEAQAQQLKLLTPIEVESETALQNMEAAGQIVPGQIYYIPEDD